MIKLDNTAKSDFQYCPLRFYFRHRKHLVTAKTATPLEFGKSIHLGFGKYYDSKRDVMEALQSFLLPYQQFAGVDEVRTVEKGGEILVAYDSQFRGEPWEDKGGEVYFEVEIAPDVIYCGLIDRIGLFAGEWTIHEFKTSSRPSDFVVRPNDQVTGYVVGAASYLREKFRNSLVTIAGVYKTSKEGFKVKKRKDDPPESIFQRHLTPRTEEDQRQFLESTVWWAHRIAKCDASGVWPTNTNNCAGKYGLCPYAPICGVPDSGKEVIIQAGYKVEKWEPGERKESNGE